MGLKFSKTLTHLVAKSTVKQSSFVHFRPIFGQKIDPKRPRSHFFLKRIDQTKFQLKIPIFSKSDDDATW